MGMIIGEKQKLWFKRRRYGYGWTPVVWQSWLLVLLYLSVVIVGAVSLTEARVPVHNSDIIIYLTYVLLATGALIRIAMLRGPKPKWRWGKHPDDDPKQDF